jgi:uncharacterized protein YndB with AHSA1/START domain
MRPPSSLDDHAREEHNKNDGNSPRRLALRQKQQEDQMEKPVVEVDTMIDMDAETIWKKMTTEKSAMFPGSTIETDWQPGHKYKLQGEWQGHSYTDYGEIERADVGRELSFTHWSKTPERPQNYHLVRYTLTPDGKKTKVSLAQFNRGPKPEVDDKTREEFRKTWTMMLDSLKRAVEEH